MESIGIRLKRLREKKGLSLRALGRAAHISHSFIKDIEAGRSKPSLDTLLALAQALGVSISDITGESEQKIESNGFSDNHPQPDPSTPSWWHRDTPPTDVELEEFLYKANIYFDGAPLNEEDKEDIITYLKVKWEREKRRREKEKEQKNL
ncbi:helix-turn-helix domain-containing protein [Desulfofundulus sp. TPOSR]|uniref:helix-turn-helix domain-containing protein n=1 Tax=Desulfofundulus sp. TPOSR TaxID=2714340 RepID=UPI0024339AAA|nr:helix-turn-helix domain-containing protein [Desulfofundulus sp. TPOSR]